MEVKLKYPITRGERTISCLKFPDKVKVKHLLAGDAYERGTVAYELAILEVMVGESSDLLQEMEYEDWVHVESVLGSRFTNYEAAANLMTAAEPEPTA